VSHCGDIGIGIDIDTVIGIADWIGGEVEDKEATLLPQFVLLIIGEADADADADAPSEIIIIAVAVVSSLSVILSGILASVLRVEAVGIVGVRRPCLPARSMTSAAVGRSSALTAAILLNSAMNSFESAHFN